MFRVVLLLHEQDRTKQISMANLRRVLFNPVKSWIVRSNRSQTGDVLNDDWQRRPLI